MGSRPAEASSSGTGSYLYLFLMALDCISWTGSPFLQTFFYGWFWGVYRSLPCPSPLLPYAHMRMLISPRGVRWLGGSRALVCRLRSPSASALCRGTAVVWARARVWWGPLNGLIVLSLPPKTLVGTLLGTPPLRAKEVGQPQDQDPNM